MSVLSVLLIAIGIGDMCRRLIPDRRPPPVIGLAVLLVCAPLAGLWHLGDIPLLIIAAVACAGWLVSCDRAERTGTRQAVPLVVFGTSVGLLILLSGWGSEAAGLVGRGRGDCHDRAIGERGGEPGDPLDRAFLA